MKISELKKSLRNEGKNFVPDLKNQVLESVGYKKHDKVFFFKPRYALLCFALIIGLLFFLIPKTNVNSILTIDINPSIELELKEDKVVEIRPLNADGSLLLEDFSESLINQDVNYCINQIIMLANDLGYLDDAKEVRLEVINDNQKQEDKLKNIIKKAIYNNQEIANIVIEDNQELRQEARKYKISVGHMKIVKSAVDLLDITIDEALQYDIQELNNLIRGNHEEKIKRVNDNYQKATQEFKNKKDQAITNLNAYNNQIIQEFKNIRLMIRNKDDFSEIKSQLENLLNQIGFKDYNITEKNVTEVINSAIEEFQDQINYQKEVIIDKYQEQVKAFKIVARDKIMNEDEFDFEFDDDFEFRKKKYNQSEQEALLIINKIQTKIKVAQRNDKLRNNLMKQITSLYDQYQTLINDNKLSNEFLESEEIQEFESFYQNFINNY